MLEIHDYDKYIVKVDGLGRLTQRNQRYLKKLFPDTGMFDSSPVVLRKPIENVCLPAGIVCKGQDVTLQPVDHHRNLQSTDVHPTQILQQVHSNHVATGMSNVIPNTIPGSPTETVTPLYDPPLLITQDSMLDTTVTKGDTTQGNSRP